jgi:hypothetical protein
MKNATATSHGRSFLLEADGAAGIEGELVELTGLMAMGSKNYCTNEWKDLLEFARDNTKSPAPAHFGLRSPGLVRPIGNHLHKGRRPDLFLRLFLATMKRP